MSTKTPALTVEEVYALPAMATGPQAFAAIGVSQYTGYELIRNGEFPIPVVRVGRSIKVRRADLLRFLGLDSTDDAATASPTTAAEPAHQDGGRP